MKKSLFYYMVLPVFAGLMSCADDVIPVEKGQEEVNKILATVEDFVEAYPVSRTTVTITDKGASFGWSDNDTIGIFPETGAQVYLLMKKNNGKTATFTGGGWALKPLSTYGAYYPFISSFKFPRTAIPVDYSGQVQEGNASTAHLGKCDYMSATPEAPVDGTVSMHFKHMGCLFHFKTKALPSVTLNKVELVTKGKDLPVKGILNIDEGKITVDEAANVSTLTLGCKDVVVADASNELTLNMMMPPFDLTGKKFYINLEFSDKSKSQIEIKGGNFVAGKAYNLTSEALKHKQVLVIEHAGPQFKIPTFTAVSSKVINGKIYWGDYNEDAFSVDAVHNYTDGVKDHSVTIGLENAEKVKFSSIKDIKGIDFTRM